MQGKGGKKKKKVKKEPAREYNCPKGNEVD